MIFRQNAIRYFLMMLFFGVFLFVSGWFLSFLNERSQKPENVRAKFQKQINQSENYLKQQVHSILVQSDWNSPESVNSFLRNHKDDFKNEGTVYLLYLNDTLTAWTDQIFAAPSKLRNFEKTKGIIASGNGYFLQFRENTGNRTIVGLQLVKYNYKFNNSYLPKGFSKKFSIPENTSLSLAKSEWNINGNDGKFLLSLSFENQNKESPLFMFLIFTLYVTSFLCIIAALFVAYLYVIRLYGHRYWLISLFVADVFILRAIQFYFQFPTSLYSLDIFSPVYFASSNWLPSLGDLIINILLLLQISYFIHKSVTSRKGKIDSSKWSILWVVAIFLLIIALFEILRLGFRDFVMNSNIPLQFE